MPQVTHLKTGMAFGPLEIAGQFHASVPQSPEQAPDWVVATMEADPTIECIAISRKEGGSVVYRNISHLTPTVNV